MVLEGAAFDVTSSLATSKTIISWVLNLIFENPILSACFVLGTLIPAGILAFVHFKNSAR